MPFSNLYARKKIKGNDVIYNTNNRGKMLNYIDLFLHIFLNFLEQFHCFAFYVELCILFYNLNQIFALIRSNIVISPIEICKHGYNNL